MKFTIKTFIMLFAMLQFSQAFAQKLDKYYTQRTQEGGDIFFIFPNEDFKNTSNNTGFLFDITYRQGADSLTINFTYRTKDPDPAKELLIISSNKELSSPAEKLYVDFIKKKWEQRYSGQFSFSEIESIISNQKPPKFTVISDGGRSEFIVKTNKWKKYTDALQKIFYIIAQD